MEARLDRPTDEGSSDSAAARLAPQTASSPVVADSTQGSAVEEECPRVTEKPGTSERSGAGTREGVPEGKGAVDDDGGQDKREGTPVQQTGDSPKASGVLLASPVRDSGGVVSPLVVKRGPGRPRKDGSSPVQRKKLSSHSFPGRPRVRSRKPSLLSLAGSSGQTPPSGSLLERSPAPYEMDLEHSAQPPLTPQASTSMSDSAHYDQPGPGESPHDKQDELSPEGSERVCALCNLGDGRSMGQGKLVRFEPTLGFQPFRRAAKLVQRAPSSSEERASASQGSTTPPLRRGGKGLRLSRGKPFSRLSAEFKPPSSTEEMLTVGFAEEPDVGTLFEPSGHTYVHRNCAAWSEGVCPGEDDSLIHVDKAVFYGMSQICSGCQKYGASIRCHLPDCGLIFHFPCAAAYGCFQDMKALILLCPSHADKAVSYVGSQANCQSCEEMVSVPELLFCTVCGAHYHGFCLDPPVGVTPTSRLGWQCPDCKTCQGCRRAGDDARLLTCDVCDKAFHVYCVKPMVANVPKHGWKCQSCRVCGDCGSRTPGSGPSSRWHMNYSVCDSCYQQRNKGVACPLCGKAYRQFSNRADMAQCTVCRKFIHVECDSQLASSPKDGDYVCPVCSNMRQQAALSLSGKSELSVRLRVPASDGSPDYMYGSQRDIASCGNDDSRSSNDNDVLQTSSGGMQSPENESKFPPPSHHSLGKPPFARFPGKRRFGVGRARASSGKFAAKRRAKAVELRRKRGPKPKLKPYYPCWNISQGATAGPPEAKDKQDESQNKMVLFSAKDDFVLSQVSGLVGGGHCNGCTFNSIQFISTSK
ncbi:histone-lysine N-methyltransferase 2C isoform X2 [Rhipicephalus sanguineus]|uniref:histone-lysine N-methyltransferase 2C isoform X2 n=1 Tax=Rhipicephalus sanguineus TaxID=34632 RepID=UPI0020C2B06F|nr:histone-lysine N-methyltransferase 2C isoform X2 [Rhipicephalus sanguineus]